MSVNAAFFYLFATVTIASGVMVIASRNPVLVNGVLFYPGDAFTVPGQPVEVLAVPAGAPWLKLAEAVDYLRRVAPRVAFPVHEKVLSEGGISIHYRQLEQLGARGGTRFEVLDDGRPLELEG